VGMDRTIGNLWPVQWGLLEGWISNNADPVHHL